MAAVLAREKSNNAAVLAREKSNDAAFYMLDR
jgi:hypothetical protein